jgi:hypothetical protein
VTEEPATRRRSVEDEDGDGDSDDSEKVEVWLVIASTWQQSG